MFVERKTPSSVPTNNSIPLAKRQWTEAFDTALAGVQLVPLFVERKRPPPIVPAKRFVPETARALTEEHARPELAVVQVVPLFVERKTPP